MHKPTRFELMRRNRPKLVKARETLRQRIDRIEREMEAGWDVTTQQLLQDMRHLESAARPPAPPPRPRAYSWWPPFRRAAL